MKAEEVAVGRAVEWVKTHRGGYGYVSVYPATIKKIGKRITIEVPLKNGGTKLVAVSHNNLRLRACG